MPPQQDPPSQAQLHLDTAYALLQSADATPLQLAAIQRAVFADRRPFYNNLGTGIQSFLGLNDKWRYYEGEVESYTTFARRLGDNWRAARNASKVVDLGKRLLRGIIAEEDPAILRDALRFITGTLEAGFVEPAVAGATYARDSLYEAGGNIRQFFTDTRDQAARAAGTGLSIVAALALAGVALVLLSRNKG